MGLGYSLFFPTITAALGFNTTDTLLLTAPPWIWAVLVSIPNAWHADYTGERFFHYAWPALACIVGYIIAICASSIGARYFAGFLMTTGYASGFVMLAWISNTIVRPPAKRAAAIALINALGNVGSICSSYIFASKYGPRYKKPFGALIGILGGACIAALALRQYLVHLNKKLEKEEGVAYELNETAVAHSASLENVAAETVREDVKKFRYLY